MRGATARFKRDANGPFGGFAGHLHSRYVGPKRCEDCENVLVQDGRLKKRFGIQVLSAGDTNKVIADSRVEGIYGDMTYPIEGATADYDDVTDLIVAKTSKISGSYANGEVYLRHAGSDGFLAASPQVDWVNGKIPNFVPIGSRSKDIDTGPEPDDVMGSQVQLYMVDGSDRATRVPLDISRRAYKVGITAPEYNQTGGAGYVFMGIDDVATQGGQVGFPPGTYEVRITLCDRSRISDADETGAPGLESNPNTNIMSNTHAAGNKVLAITIDLDQLVSGEFFTHFRVYWRSVDDNETDWLYGGMYNKSAEWEIGDEVDSFVSDPDFNFPGSEGYIEIQNVARATGTGAYDYAPTRNHVPEKMRYMATFRGRSYWARDDLPQVFYSDVVGPQTGGHYEHLSTEFLDPFDAPVSLLARYQDSLIIGTSNGIHRMTGLLSSHTNQTIAANAIIPMSSHAIEQITDDLGPVYQGTGHHVIADGIFYYISREGLMAFNGNVAVNVSKAIRPYLPVMTEINEMNTAMLAHDPVRNIIYMMTRVRASDGVGGYGKYSGDLGSTTGQVESTIWCYHYRAKDSETGLGEWTRFTSIGVTSAANGNDQRYTAIGMRRFGAANTAEHQTRLAVGMRVNDTGDGRFDDCSVFSEGLPTAFSDNQTDEALTADKAVSALWKSGQWDVGLFDMRKALIALTVDVLEDAAKTGDTLTVSYALDGGSLKSRAFAGTKSLCEVGVGSSARYIATQVAWSSTYDEELFGYSVDVAAMGQH
jgi:hypothetical protein